MKRTVDPARTTLLLAAHGSSRPGGDNPVWRLAQRLKAEGLFADVCCSFLKEAPLLPDVLSTLRTQDLVVVPMLTGHGYITDELIPDALQGVDSSVTIHLCKPLGSHPSIPGVMAEQALSVIRARNLSRDRVSILIAAHGNAKNPEIARQTKALATRIENLTDGVPVQSAFIEVSPLISDWPKMTAAENLIVLPFLIGGGLHGVEDVPAMLGLNPLDPALGEPAGDIPMAGPFRAHGRTIWYCRAIGHEPVLADMIYDLVKAGP